MLITYQRRRRNHVSCVGSDVGIAGASSHMRGEKENNDTWQRPSICDMAEQNDLVTGDSDDGRAGAVTFVSEHQECEGPKLKEREEDEPAATERDSCHTGDETTLSVSTIPGTTRPTDGPRTLTSCQARDDMRSGNLPLGKTSFRGRNDVRSNRGKSKGCAVGNRQRKISSFFLKGAASEQVSLPVAGNDKSGRGYRRIISEGCFKQSVGSKWKSKEGEGKENGNLSHEEEEVGKRADRLGEGLQDAAASTTMNCLDWPEDEGKKWMKKRNNVFEILKLHSKSSAIKRTGIRELAPNRVYQEQYFLDAGQSDFTCTTCHVCGLVYARGVEQDEKVHIRIHRRHLEGIRFELGEILRTIERELGLPMEWMRQKHCKIYLYVATKRVLGCVAAEAIREAFPILTEQNRSRRDPDGRLPSTPESGPSSHSSGGQSACHTTMITIPSRNNGAGYDEDVRCCLESPASDYSASSAMDLNHDRQERCFAPIGRKIDDQDQCDREARFMTLGSGMMAGKKRDLNWMGVVENESSPKRQTKATAMLRHSHLRHLCNVNKAAEDSCHDMYTSADWRPQGVNCEEKRGTETVAEDGVEKSIEGAMMRCVKWDVRKDLVKAEESSGNRAAIDRCSMQGDFHDDDVQHSLKIGTGIKGHEEHHQGPAEANACHGRGCGTAQSAMALRCCKDRDGDIHDDAVRYSLQIGKGHEEDNLECPAALNERDDGTTRSAKEGGCCCCKDGDGDFHDTAVQCSLQIGKGHEEGQRQEGPAAANGCRESDDSTTRSAKEGGCCCKDREGGGYHDAVRCSLKIGKGHEEGRRQEGPAAANGGHERDVGTTRSARKAGCCCKGREAEEEDENRSPMSSGRCRCLLCSSDDGSRSGHVDDRSAEEAQEGTSDSERRERGFEMVGVKGRGGRNAHLGSTVNWHGGSMFRNSGSSGSKSKANRTHHERGSRVGKVMRALVCSDTSVKAVCGVRAIWVWHRARRKGIGSKLLDAVR
ncbi:hypothetical protein CBR_g53714 [Chara braunii]|uniref:N-acetyltransferase ESCO zinc-finger domain-containing protein n=1 Tax=Chara braunii TaxID=69332 RepID=A0A388MBE1_CHABU|nr:hypothetical protein CBR_g53714 [Chara braunii]|eukprot:GBG91823.1 hypothetical protein CBR_g53714 [Chara braunii]